MKKLLILLCVLSLTSSVFAQKKRNKNNGITLINQSDLPVASSEAIEPLSSFDNLDSLQTPKWKDYWKFSGTVGLKISQTQLINWAAGGNSNFTGVSYVNLLLNYKKNKIAWDTNLDTDFGALYSSDFNSYKWRKGNDKINFKTTFGYEISTRGNTKNMWFVAANGSFRSQYLPGYNYPDNSRIKASDWLSPSYTDLSIGINWKWKEIIILYYSPVAGLVTSCTDSILRTSVGVPIDKNASASLGMTFSAEVKYDAVKNLVIKSVIKLYTPYTDLEQKFGNFNVDWDVIVTYQFLKILNVSLTTNLKYYPKFEFNEPEKPKRRVQFQEMFGLGVAYSF
jgi:hypothetical protein